MAQLISIEERGEAENGWQKEAEASYQKALSIWLENKSYNPDEIMKQAASIYHQLGMVAQEQRQWHQAEAYYQQALLIYIEFNNRYEQAVIYGRLGLLPEFGATG